MIIDSACYKLMILILLALRAVWTSVITEIIAGSCKLPHRSALLFKNFILFSFSWLNSSSETHGTVSRVDRMFVVKAGEFTVRSRRARDRLDLTVKLSPRTFYDPTNCPWVSEDGLNSADQVFLSFLSFIWFILKIFLKFGKSLQPWYSYKIYSY